MTRYQPRIWPQGDSFYAFIVRVDRDGEEQVIRGYASRMFASRKAAEKSTAAYIAKVSA